MIFVAGVYKLSKAPYNLHFNVLIKEAYKIYKQDGDNITVMYLDDDDSFTEAKSAEKIIDLAETIRIRSGETGSDAIG